MRNYPLLPLLPVFVLSGCGGTNETPAANNAAAQFNAAAIPDNAIAAAEDKKPAPSSDCVGVQDSNESDNVLGIAPGMSPAQASALLICKGYVATFPVGDDHERTTQQEEQQGIFRRDFGRKDRRDYVRLFSEGKPGAQQIFYVARASYFGDNAPTMEAVAQQYVDAYNPPEKPYQYRFGITRVGKVNISEPISGRASPEATRKHCVDVAFLHDAGDRFSTVMNVPPRPDPDCGPSMTLEVIPNGRNKEVAYLAHYRASNLRLAASLRDQRNAADEAAQDAQRDAETQDAKANGELPDL